MRKMKNTHPRQPQKKESIIKNKNEEYPPTATQAPDGQLQKKIIKKDAKNEEYRPKGTKKKMCKIIIFSSYFKTIIIFL